jgi:anaerobic magnesium-protoporphyrin IX monomethyl ester cyclase
VINAERTAGFKRLFRYKLRHYPLQTARLLRRFLRHMRLRDVLYLIIKPFLGNKWGPTKNEVLSRAVEHGAQKEAAASLTRVSDTLLEEMANVSNAKPPRASHETAIG